MPFWVKCCLSSFASRIFSLSDSSWCFHSRRSQSSSMAFKPTEDEASQIVDMGTLLDFAGMSGTAPPHVTHNYVSQKQGFLALLGLEPSQHFRIFAMTEAAALTAALSSWEHNGAPAGLGLQSMASCAHKTARCLCKLDQWPGTEPAPSPPAASSAAATAGPLTQVIGMPTVKLHEWIDQKVDETITYVPTKKFQETINNHIISEGKSPRKSGCTQSSSSPLSSTS